MTEQEALEHAAQLLSSVFVHVDKVETVDVKKASSMARMPYFRAWYSDDEGKLRSIMVRGDIEEVE